MLFTGCFYVNPLFLLVRCTNFYFVFSPKHSSLVAKHLGERPYDLSSSTECLQYPASAACSPQPLLILFPAVQLSLSESVFPLPGSLSRMVCLHLPLKIFSLLSSNNDGARSHPVPTPYQVFSQYFAEHQTCRFKRGVLFFFYCSMLADWDNVFSILVCCKRSGNIDGGRKEQTHTKKPTFQL